jgi:hypothetical protein
MMSGGIPFEIQGTVDEFPAKKKGAKGIYWNVLTSVGRVNIKQDDEPKFEEGVIYNFKGISSSFKNEKNEEITMKWAHEFGKADGAKAPTKTEEKTIQTQKPATPDPTMPTSINPATLGMILNNSTALTVAQVQNGACKPDDGSVKACLEKWNKVLSDYAKTGVLYF